MCASSIIQINHDESEGETVQNFYRASNEFREIQKKYLKRRNSVFVRMFG